MRAELIYDTVCPNVVSARAQLLRAFAEAGIRPQWREWNTAAPETPAHARGYGSPTILIDGRDVCDGPESGGEGSCRVYSLGKGGYRGVPPLADIVRALKSGQGGHGRAHGAPGWSFNGALVPAIGLSLLPKLTCPACWPAYAGLLGTLGVGFFDYTPFLLPFTIVFLLIAVGGFAFRARRRHGYRPLLLGLAASAVLLAGKFVYDSDTAMYAGIAVLVAASVWNAWPTVPRQDSGQDGRVGACEDTCGRTESIGDSRGS